MSRPLAYLNPRRDRDAPFADLAPPDAPLQAVHEADLTAQPPESIAALLVPMHIDQRRFAAAGSWIAAFLAAGGTLVFNGLLAYPYHDMLRPFEPLAEPGLAGLHVSVDPSHPVWHGVDAQDLTFRCGVAGFYGRGCNPPPDGARVINTIGHGRCPVDWEWHVPGGGRMLMHAGNDLWMYARDETSAARVTSQLLRWCAYRLAEAAI